MPSKCTFSTAIESKGREEASRRMSHASKCTSRSAWSEQMPDQKSLTNAHVYRQDQAHVHPDNTIYYYELLHPSLNPSASK